MEKNTTKLPFRSCGSKLRISRCIGLFISVFMFSGVFAQQTSMPPNLTKDQLVLFGKTAGDKVSELQSSINIIVDKSRDDYRRDKAVESAKLLFVDSAKMEVSTLYPNGTVEKNKYDIEEYFIKLKRLKYKEATVKFYDLFLLSDFLLGNDGRYHATATIYMKFKGVTTDGVVYEEKTIKTIDIILEYAEDPFFKTNRWMVKLGNVKVQDTRAA